MRALRAVLVCLCLWLGSGSGAHAQTLPAGPVVFADGHVTVAGDFSASFGSSDPGFFDYTDYEHSALRSMRIDISGVVKGGERIAFVGELRTENLERPQAYALYLRVRPWRGRNFDIQAGRIPPTFGAFARRTYPTDNPLIGYPLAYQYLTSLRPDALPESAEELLRNRGRGWLDRFSIGDKTAGRGVPLVSAFRWDTGVQVHGGSDRNLISAAVR
jgi:prepilin-type processing-associated H-X9-DG protein